MIIETNKVVVITYEMSVEGKVIDKAGVEEPFDFIQGNGMVLPSLERKLEGLSEGDEFECTIPPEEGYGEYDLSKVFDIPKSTFVIDGSLREDLLEVGRFIPLLNSRGEVCQAMVVEVKEDKVTMDFNMPMAGKTMDFKGKVISVRDATPQELLEGLHGEFLPQEHNCHGHGGGCCHGEGHHGDGEGCCHNGDGEGCCHHGDGEGCCHNGD